MKRVIALLLVVSLLSFAFMGCAGKTNPIDQKGNPKFVRISEKGILGGVCAGVAYYSGINVTIVRVVTVVTAFALGTGILAYLIIWAIMPDATHVPADYGERTGG